MDRTVWTSNARGAAIVAVVSFGGALAAGMYAAVDEPNIGAALLAMLLLAIAALAMIVATVSFFMSRHVRREARGFEVVVAILPSETNRSGSARRAGAGR